MPNTIKVYLRIGKSSPKYLSELLNILKERTIRAKMHTLILKTMMEGGGIGFNMNLDSVFMLNHIQNIDREEKASQRASPRPQSDEGLA